MKYTLFTMLSLISLVLSAQDNDYAQLRGSLARHEGGIKADARVVAVVFLDASDESSLESARELSRAVRTFKVAKLSGGPQGLIGLCVVRGSHAGLQDASSFHDLLFVSLPEDAIDIKNNAFYDSAGRLIYKDLPAGEIFNSVQKLITR
jgi:hypothetical protein